MAYCAAVARQDDNGAQWQPLPGRGLRLAVSIDDNLPQMIDAGEASVTAKPKNFGKLAADNAQTLKNLDGGHRGGA